MVLPEVWPLSVYLDNLLSSMNDYGKKLERFNSPQVPAYVIFLVQLQACMLRSRCLWASSLGEEEVKHPDISMVTNSNNIENLGKAGPQLTRNFNLFEH